MKWDGMGLDKSKKHSRGMDGDGGGGLDSELSTKMI